MTDRIKVMATITRVPVTLTHEEADELCRILNAHASTNWAHARRTTSAAIRTYAETTANRARDLEAAIVRRMFQTTDK